jgi:uncharacterized integral membrane protein
MKKGAVPLDRAVLLLRVGCALLLALGAVMLLEGPAKILSHDYEQPSYKHHHHHLCHVLTMALCVASVWWATLLVLLVRNREAMQHEWARRLFGLPVLVLAVVGCVAGYYVWVTIDSHDEVTYAAVLGVACGSVVCVLALVNFSLLIPLREERTYAWNYLALSATFLGSLFAVLYYNDHHWHWALILTAASLLSFVAGLYMSKLVLAAQKIV